MTTNRFMVPGDSRKVGAFEDFSGGTDAFLSIIPGTSLKDGYRSVVIKNDIEYGYYYNATSGAAENIPNVVSPNVPDGDGRWILISSSGSNNSFTVAQVHTAWETGLADTEIYRVELGAGEILSISRIALMLESGGVNTDLSIDVYDEDTTTVLTSTTGGIDKAVSVVSSAAATVLIRITNNDPSSVNACFSVTMSRS